MMRRRSWGILVAGIVGCSPSPLPDPRIAARAYAAAAQAGDADAIYGMLSTTSRRALSPAISRVGLERKAGARTGNNGYLEHGQARSSDGEPAICGWRGGQGMELAPANSGYLPLARFPAPGELRRKLLTLCAVFSRVEATRGF